MIDKIKSFAQKHTKTKPAFNQVIFFMTILISLFGMIIIFSASSNLTIKYNLSPYYYVIRQGLFVIPGILIMYLISIIDFRFYRKYRYFIYGISIVFLLMALFSPFAVLYNGYARRGLKLVFNFMPSDVYKIASIIFLSAFLVNNKLNEDKWVKGFIWTAIVILGPTILIYLQPDLSTFLVIVLALGSMYLLGGFRAKFFIPVILIFAAGLIFFYYNGRGYQLERVLAFLDPEKYKDSLSWHIMHSLYAVSRGGLFGVGYSKSVLKYGYLADEVNSDMIFAVIAEELGFIVSIGFILYVFILSMLILNEAKKVRSEFGKNLLTGIAFLYLIQSFVNIGVAINAIPNTGITLPFISYGGTSILIYFAMFGIVLNVSRFNNEDLIRKKKKKKNKVVL